MKHLIYLVGTILLGFALYVRFFAPSTLPLSPLGSPLESSVSNLESSKYVVLGFAPYWNLKKITPASLSGITHLAYFHLLLNSDGTIYTKLNRREEDPGYTNYKRLLSGSLPLGDKPLVITFMPESQTALSSMLSSSQSRAKTIATIAAVVHESNAAGLNIDFEPTTDVTDITRTNFTSFIKELRSTLPSTQLSISIYASTATRPRLWDLKSLSPLTNYFVVMTYDYTMPGSPVSGPNAPLRGAGTLFEHDVIKNIAALSALVPTRQLLLGIPFYGYQWKTASDSKYAPASSKGSVASLDRVDQMLADKSLSLLWDRNTLTPYGISTVSGQTTQIYFENDTSIRLKLEFVKSAKLGGIAIWALGYEGNTPWIWPTIATLNK